MVIENFERFFAVCNPSKTIDIGNLADRPYYINFATVRGGKMIGALSRTIRILAPNQPTCQLFSGHIGCGKSTDLLRLKAELEQGGFHVVYFDSTQDLDMGDVDISDILLAIARQVSVSLEEQKIRLQPSGFKALLQEAADLLQTPMDVEISLALGISKITAKTKDSARSRSRLRQLLEPQTNTLLQAINQELLEPAIDKLKQQGKRGLVVIVDNLDRIDPQLMAAGKPQLEYIFVDRGDQLNRLNCHVVYTIPLSLIVSNNNENLRMRLGGGVAPKVLPLIPVQRRDGTEYEPGIALLRQMVLARAFPDMDANQRLNHITDLFDSPDTLDRLCCISGGHVRNLLGFMWRCLQEDDPPWSRDLLERVIQQERDLLLLSIDDQEWELLLQVVQRQNVRGDQEYHVLLHRLWLFEYRDERGNWFDINPILAEAIEARKNQEVIDKALAKAERFLKQTGATTSREEGKNILQVSLIPGRLKSYLPLSVMFTEQSVDQHVTQLMQHAAQFGDNRQQQVGILLYREPPDTIFRMRITEVRLRDHFVVIPIPFAAVEQVLTDEAASTGLLAQYAERYLPGADLFDDRNAIGDTLCFFGRGNLLHSLEEDLRRNQGIGLFGLRKSGKTSLLLQLGFAMRQYPVVHIDLQPYGGKPRYGAELFNKILQELSQLIKKRTPNTIQNWETFQRDCPAADLGIDFARQVSDLAKLLSESGYQLPILLFLDEIERILPTKEDSRERVEEFNAFFGGVRALSQNKKLVSILIADVHPDANRINHWSQNSIPTNPVFSFFKEIFLSPFSQEETTEMLTEIGKLMGVAFDNETLVAIHRESGGHPFIARQLASFLCQQADKEKSDQGELIKFSAVTRYLKKPFKYSGILKDYFDQNIWADLKKRKIFSAMAVLQLLACNEELPEGVKEEALFERLRSDFSEGECMDALLWLENVGLVVREELEDDDSYQLQILLMSRWLKMQMKSEDIYKWKLN